MTYSLLKVVIIEIYLRAIESIELELKLKEEKFWLEVGKL